MNIAQLVETVLEEWREWDVEDMADDLPHLVEKRKPRHDQLVRIVQHVKTVLRRRMECDVKDDVVLGMSSDEGENDTVTTSPPDILAPAPFPPSPNILVQQSQPHSQPLPNQQHPPDIVAPQPLPLKPNISTPFAFVSNVRGRT